MYLEPRSAAGQGQPWRLWLLIGPLLVLLMMILGASCGSEGSLGAGGSSAGTGSTSAEQEAHEGRERRLREAAPSGLSLPQVLNPPSCTGNPGICNARLIAAGYSHTVAVKADGTAWAFGWNIHGQLGDNTTTTRVTPVPVIGLSDVIAVAAGSYHTMAVKADGTAWAFGRNNSGQLGDNTTTTRLTSVQVIGLNGVLAVAAGDSHTVAVKADDTAWAFGHNFYGQLGDNTTTTRLTPVPVIGLSGVIAVAAGYSHTVAVKTDGTAWAFGENFYGQLGDNTTTTRLTPVPVTGLSDVIAVAAGSDHTVALKADGTVWAFGHNGFGQLGDNTTTTRLTPVPVTGLSGVLAVAAGSYHTVALKADGTVWAFGWNSDGQLGDNTTTTRLTPVPVTGLSLAPAGPCDNGVRVCDQGTGNCVFPVLSDGTPCDDGNLCTQPGTCQTGVCADQSPISCPAPDACHKPGTCDPATGMCDDPVKSDGVSCDDGNACTQLDECQAGVCVGKTPITCPAPNVCRKPGTCDAATGMCDDPVEDNGVDCDDGDACTQLDRCQAGMCVGKTPVTCPAPPNDCHKPGSCDPATGMCDNPVKDNGAACDDHDACTQDDRCKVGMCVGMSPVLCPENDGCHKPSTCDPATGLCDNPVRDDGFLCSDGDPCTENDRCEAAQCKSGAQKVCPQHLRCDPQVGDCLTSCASVNDCADGFVCDRSHHCVQPPPEQGSVDDAGCTIARVAARGEDRAPSAWSGLLLLAALAPLRRQRPSVFAAGQGQPRRLRRLIGPMLVLLLTILGASCGSDGSLGKGGSSAETGGTSSEREAHEGQALRLREPAPSGRSLPQMLNPLSCTGNPGICNAGLVAAGSYHTVAVKADDTVWAFGFNGSGQLGDNSTTTRLTPVQVAGLSGVVAVAAGGHYTVVVKAADTVWAFGQNSFGQLGDNTTATRLTPVQVIGLSGVITVAAGYGHTVAVKADDTVWTFGWNGFGQLGDNTTTTRLTPVQVIGLSGVIAVAAGYGHTVAVKADGTVWAFGRNGSGQLGDNTTTNRLTPVQVIGLSGVIAVAAGEKHTVAVKVDGTVWAFGQNLFGQLGDNTTNESHTPVQVKGLSDVIAVAAGYYHTVALKADGTVWAFGRNSSGQLGDNTTNESHTPVQVIGLSGVLAVAAGFSHTVALKADGTVWAFGSNSSGQLGDNTTNESHTPVQVTGLSLAPAGQCDNGVSVCDPGTGTCVFPTLPAGTPCDEGNLCTQPGTCQADVCADQSPIPCPAPPDDCHEPGTCDPTTGLCDYKVKDDTVGCDDGDACTKLDQCQAGVCVGKPPAPCPPPDDCHKPGTCTPATGLCDYPATLDGAFCDDGNACTPLDECQAGVCVGKDQIPCAALDDCHKPGTCAPATGLCDNPMKDDGVDCDDGDACTKVDRCNVGVCVGESPVVCPKNDGCHKPSTCDPATGQCDNPIRDDGFVCSDDDPCTENDRCEAGQCKSGAQKVCPQHLRCDPQIGDCLTSCASVNDCVDGYACDRSHRCVQPPAAQGSVNDAGCTFASAAARGEDKAPSAGSGLLLLAALAPLRRRVRHKTA